MRRVVGIGALGAVLLACSGSPFFASLLPAPRAHGPVVSAAPKPTAKPKAPEPPMPLTVDLPVGASPGTPAAERTTEIVRDLVTRFDLWPGLGLHTVYPAQFGKVLAADDVAPLYGALVEAHQALVLDAQHVALGQAPGATISADVKTWKGMHEAAMLTAYLRAWAGRASLPTRLVTLVRARLGHWEEVLGAPRIVAVATTLGVVPPKNGFALGGASRGTISKATKPSGPTGWPSNKPSNGEVPSRSSNGDGANG